jgi:aspartokinase
MRNNPIIVQKYGGACLETPAKIRAVASSFAGLHSRGHRVVAIVSAMGKTTDELVKMAYQVSPHERISMSLMSMALSDLGVPAISLTGSQAEVMTDESHSFAHFRCATHSRARRTRSRTHRQRRQRRLCRCDSSRKDVVGRRRTSAVTYRMTEIQIRTSSEGGTSALGTFDPKDS